MQKIRRFLICCLIWVGLVPGRSSLAADAASGAQDPAARARLELERQASQSSAQTSSAADTKAKSAAELQNQAKTLAAKQTTAPGPKVRYATSRPVKLSPPPPSAEDVARQERLAQIEREVERRRAERAGKAPAAVAVANKPQEVSPVPPATAGAVAPAPVVVSRETALPTESEEKQRNQSLREKLAADRARLAADREAAEQQKAQQRQRREGLALSNQTPPPVATLAPAPAQPVASREETERKARVDKVQSELDSKQFAQNSAGGVSRAPLAGPAPSLPVLSLDQERKARELLRQTLAELEQEEAAAGKKAKPAKTAPAPIAAAPAPAPAPAPKPAVAPAPAPTAPPAPSPELELKRQEEQSRLAARELIRQEGERVEAEKKAKAAQAKVQADRAEAERRSKQAQEAQAKADAKARAERAKADADKARADARLQEAKAKLHTRTEAEQAAETQAKNTQAKKAAAAPAAAIVAAPTPTTKAEKLAALLKSYTRSESPISAEEYHRERAKLLSEP